MTVRNLDSLFRPDSIAVIGASAQVGSVGATVLHNLMRGGFSGPVMPVNPKYPEISGRKVWPSVSSLPAVPAVAVICTPPATVPGLIAELGARGTKAAIVITAGLADQSDADGRTLKEAMLEAARPHLLRVLGPNCVGLLIPGLGINASFAHIDALDGNIAFVSQSGGLITGVLDWAKSKGIGFSKFVSLGEGADVDFGDLLDYLGSDPHTHAILLYMESIGAARKFMSAARAAARNKPVLVLKAGRVPEGMKAAASHTRALVSRDDVYDAAIRRAGMLRVFTTEDLFGAVETLALRRPLNGERLAIMTNGGGPGVMATDALVLGGGRLASLSADTLHKLDAVLPPTWSHGNPVDIVGDAPAQRYVKTMEILLEDPLNDAVLFIHVPTAIVPSAQIAAQVAPVASCSQRSVLACCLGGDAVAQAKTTLRLAGIPTYDTPEQAVRAFLQMVDFRRAQDLLMEVPPSGAADLPADRDRAQAIIRAALASGRSMLSETEAKALLAAYGISVVQTQIAATAAEAADIASELGFPVALKILSPDITHKSDVGGVALDLGSAEAVHAAIEAMSDRVRSVRPEARLQGFTVQKMVRRPHAHELIVGVATDATFGPVLLFGHGGVAAEVTGDHAIGLLPLNMVLAREVISRTRVARLLAGYRDRPAADLEAICRTLVRISQMLSEIAEITELDINPLLADEDGVLALDARIGIAPAAATALARFAIRPYPAELEEWISWQGERILLRPIKPEDGSQHLAFFHALDPEDVRMRAFTAVREIPRSQLGRLTQIDYDREMAFIATTERVPGRPETLGVVRAVADPDNNSAEFGIVVASHLKGKKLGGILLHKMIEYLRSRGTPEVIGETLPYNRPLLALVRRFGFEAFRKPDSDTVSLRLHLRPRVAT